jgi:threonine-phosphate decarboxylase
MVDLESKLRARGGMRYRAGAEDSLIQARNWDVYALSRAHGWDWRDVLDLSVSINPLGPPDGVREAIIAAADSIGRYPEVEPHDAAAALAERWGAPGDSLLLGNGATELLYFMARAAWQGPVSIAVPTGPDILRAFPRAIKVPVADPERWPQRGLLILTQPNAITGEAIAPEVLRRAIAAREGPVVVEESFLEFTDLESAIGWVDSHPNLLVLRSMSKFYALPGVRIGALAAGKEWIDRLRRRREPWSLSILAEAAVRAALSDETFVRRSRAFMNAEREWVTENLRELPGVEIAPGIANFLFARIDRKAEEFLAEMLERRIILNTCTSLPGIEGEAIRFAVRGREENQRFLEAARACFTAA